MTNLISQKNFDSTTIKRQVNTASGITTDFTITGGYNPGFIDVFLNGVKQRSGTDFTATSGTIVTMVPYTNVGDVLEFQIYENMDVAGVSSVTNATNAYNIVGGVSFATSAGISTALNSDSSINTSGIITASQLAISGLSTSKDLLVTGITSATNIIEIKSNDSTPGRIDLYCETNNAHYARLQAPEHGDFGGNITVKLPSSTGTLLLSDGSGASLTSLNASNLGSGTIPDARFPATLPAISGQNLTGIVTGIQAGDNITILESPAGNFIVTSTASGGSGIEIENSGTSVGTAITAINFNTNLTAIASGGIATITATGGSETQTLDDVLGLGNTSSTGLSVGIITATSFVKSSNSGGFLKADGTEDTNIYLTSYTETQTLDDVLGLGNISGIGLSVGVVTATSFDVTTLRVGTGITAEAGIITATSFVKRDGTSSQFLKADGSVDSSTYLTSYTETDPVVAAINGIVKSDGSTISAASAGTDYLAPTGDGSGLSGIVTSIVAGSNITISGSTGEVTINSSGGGGGGSVSVLEVMLFT